MTGKRRLAAAVLAEAAVAAQPTKVGPVAESPAAQDEVATGQSHAMPSAEALRAEIAELAYQLWIQGGCRHGRDLEDWAEAERRVLSRYR